MRRAFPIVCAVVVTLGITSPTSAGDPDPPMPRVRTENAAIAALLAEASRLSTTFRTLIDTINASDGLVYIDPGECAERLRACMLHSVQLAGPNRLLHVKIDPRRSRLGREPFDADSIGLLGHELQHVVEVLSHPDLRSSGAITTFYMRVGVFSAGIAMETVEATSAGLRVKDEINSARKNLLIHQNRSGLGR